MTARTFPLADVLTATTGCLVSPRGIEAMYDLLGFMTGDTLWTHQLPRAIEECKPHILAQHPDLAAVPVPAKFKNEAHVWEWVTEMEDKFGVSRELTPMPAEDHTRIHPVGELRMMVPAEKIIVVEGGE